MEHPVTFLLIVLTLTELVFFLSLGFQLLISPKRFVEMVFPRTPPSTGIWHKRTASDTDSIFLYYGARIFAAGVPALVVLLTLHKMGIH